MSPRGSSIALALDQRDAQAHAGERARAPAHRQHVELRSSQPGFGQQGVRPGQRQFRMPARGDLESLMHLAVDPQGDGTGFGGGLEGEQLHAVQGTAEKNASTSPMSRVRGNGGSDSRKVRP